MPELPEVEAARHLIATHALHLKVDYVQVEEQRVLQVTKEKLWGNITNHAFEAADRHGKYALIRLDNKKWLVLHFGMTGDVVYYDDPEKQPEHSRVIFHFRDGSRLAFVSQRLFGAMSIAHDKQDFIQSKQLGPDALSLSYKTFQAQLAGRRGIVKTALMDQSLLAGIGNVYSDEILFQSRLHPRSLVHSLSENHCRTLYDCLNFVLKTATECCISDEPLPHDFLTPHRSQGESCPVCRGEVEQVEISGRNAYCCPNCQEIIS